MVPPGPTFANDDDAPADFFAGKLTAIPAPYRELAQVNVSILPLLRDGPQKCGPIGRIQGVAQTRRRHSFADHLPKSVPKNIKSN